jgi:hypothetical protein
MKIPLEDGQCGPQKGPNLRKMQISFTPWQKPETMQ